MSAFPLGGVLPESLASLSVMRVFGSEKKGDGAGDNVAADGLTIDELAAKTRVPSRTIRFYQSKNVLPKPTMKGRVAYYDTIHVERLKLVEELQDRGLTIKAIGDVVARLDKGELALNEWLGLEDQLKEPWANDKPKIVEEAELRELAGLPRPGRIAELVRANFVERRGDAFLIPSPALLQFATRLEEVGIELGTSKQAESILRKNLGRTAKELVEFLFSRSDGITVEDGAEMVKALRPTVLDALRIVFAQEVEREIRKVVEEGRTMKLSKRKR